MMFKIIRFFRSNRNHSITLTRKLSENGTAKSKKIGLVGMGNVGNIYYVYIYFMYILTYKKSLSNTELFTMVKW